MLELNTVQSPLEKIAFDKIRLIVGLGNPTMTYQGTRHNIGFDVLDILAKASNWQEKFSGQISKTNGLILFKPMTYMNKSGEPTRLVTNFYKLLSEQFCVIHDDVDLPIGKIKIKQGGGTGGHNGLKSLDANLENNYYRLRIGVGRPENSNISTADYVLSKFNHDQQIVMEQTINTIKNFILKP